MASGADAFQLAAAKFSARLTQKELCSFKFSNIDDVRVAMKDIQEEQGRQRKLMNLTRIKGFLEAMEQYGRIIDVFLNASSILCFIWGPMKFLLQVSSSWAESFDILLDAYQELSQRLPLLEEYKALFGDNPYMRDILVMIYEDILEFHQSALRFFGRPTWRQLFRATWKDFKGQFQNILENLRRHRELIEIRASLIQFQESRALRSNVNSAFEATKNTERNNKRLAVVSWLSAADSDLDQEASVAERLEHPGTGRWIFDKPEMKAWCDPDSTLVPALWLNGIPGAGKTILTSVIVEECKKLPSISVVFFYCKHLDAQRNTFLAVARGLLTQLLSKNEDLLPYMYEQCLLSGQSLLTSAELSRNLLETALTTVSKTYILIDGIDECPLVERSAILRFFTSTIEKCETLGKIRGLFVSQDENDIRKLLRTALIIRLKSSDNCSDIRAYSNRWSLKIQTKFGLSIEEREYVTSAVCGRAEEMFLFAKLVLTNLHSQASKADLYKELQPGTFPTGFDQAYGRIVTRILQNPKDAERKWAQKLLGWVVCARRPLKWHEIQGAVSIDLKDQTVEFEDRHLRFHVKDVCGSLIDILPGDRVALVHSTAEIHLIQGKHVDVAKEECNLAILSLHYLTFECFMNDLPDEKLRAYLQKGYFAFQDYAVIHWVDHLESAIRTLRRDDCPNLDDLHCAVDDFWALYGVDASNFADVDKELEEKCRGLIDVEYQEKVLSLITEAWRARKAEEKMSALGMLGQIIQKNRLPLEKWSILPSDEASTREKLELYYGDKWYKCLRHHCFFFHEGFKTEERRIEHLERHERPYCCTEFGCPRIHVGYPSERELKKHIDVNHPDPSSFAWKFPKVKKEPIKHRCSTCGKEYTRSNSLRVHLFTHRGERPYKCKICAKAFVRKHGCERHELNVHAESL